MIPVSMRIASKLREEGFIVDVDLLRRGLSKALKHANSIKAKDALIIGAKEYKDKNVIIRNLETGEQKTIKIDDLTLLIKKKN
jgi:histidyl-tRNA synthetase